MLIIYPDQFQYYFVLVYLKEGRICKLSFLQRTLKRLDYLMSGSSTLASNEFKNRHDRVGQ